MNMFQRLFGLDAKSALVSSAYDEFAVMLQQAAKMYDAAVAGLLDNTPIEVDLKEMDDVIDDGEQNIRRILLEHLAVNPEHQLVASLALLSIVQDAERMGDFAAGIGDVVDLAREKREGPFADDLRAISERLRPQFDACERAFCQDDAELAREVALRHTRIKADLITYTEKLAESDLSAGLAVVYGAAARILRRISAHLANIASAVSQPFDRLRHGDEDA